MNKPVEGMIRDTKERYKGGVLKYGQMGYWRPDYEPKDTDVICVFRITPQEGVDPDEAAAAVAGGFVGHYLPQRRLQQVFAAVLVVLGSYVLTR